MSLRTVEVAPEQLLTAASQVPGFPYQQRPSFGVARAPWEPLFVGWYADPPRQLGAAPADEPTPVAVAMVLLRRLPRTKWSLAYLPEGPYHAWLGTPAGPRALADLLPPLVDLLRDRGCVGIKIGPRLVRRRWSAGTVRAAVAGGRAQRLRDVEPDRVDADVESLAPALASLGWTPYEAPAAGFGGTMQPRYGMELRLADGDPSAVIASMSSLWRRNIARSQRMGVTTTFGDRADLSQFHRMLCATADREGFTPRPLSYFEAMWDAMQTLDPGRLKLHLTAHEGRVCAASLTVTAGGRTSYIYGGSSEEGRSARASNANYQHMVAHACAEGSQILDLRGISDGLSATDPHLGLLRFKLGTGADVVEYLGEWDIPVRPMLARVVQRVLERRQR